MIQFKAKQETLNSQQIRNLKLDNVSALNQLLWCNKFNAGRMTEFGKYQSQSTNVKCFKSLFTPFL